VPLIEEPEDAADAEEDGLLLSSFFSDADSSNDEEIQPPSDVDEDDVWGFASTPKF
jgi:hypothetical protein